MKFTLSWLKEHLQTDSSVEEICDKLSLIGLEVESVENAAEALGAFTICRVIEAKQHPNADRLRVCMVDTGSGDPVQVVCGAPNARTGMIGVFAGPGTHIPGTGVDLQKGNIRGQDSFGMLCSERELMLSDDHQGIIDLPEDAPVGTRYVDYAGLDDAVIDIAITPNRGDALGVAGVARDLAAAGLGNQITKTPAPVKGDFPSPVSVRIDLPEGKEHLCPAFALRMVKGVKNGPSPEWLQKRLKAIGLRPINALVDITNYITFDRGRPLHVFDAAKVRGDLAVRLARSGESLTALDGKDYSLTGEMVVIGDEYGVESLAGIMGGESTGCEDGTVDVLIESALWDPKTTAATGRALGIHSDARYRFERGVDPAFCVPGLDMATTMVIELCGGTPSETVLAGAIPGDEKVITYDPAAVSRLTGLDVPFIEQKAILSRLGFWVAGNPPECKVAVPSFRPDVHEAADIVEEVIRLVGVDRIVPQPLPREARVPKPVLTALQQRSRGARRALAARGMVEAVTWSFIQNEHASLFGGGDKARRLANPISADMSDMRPSPLPGLVLAAQKNADRGLGDTALFEVGATYGGGDPEDQREVAAGVRRGTAGPSGNGRHWTGNASAAGVFDAKADAMAALAEAGAPVASLQTFAESAPWYHPGRSGSLRLGPKNVLATFGELHPRVLSALGADGPVAGFEIFLDALPTPKARATRAKPALDLSDLMPLTRDFAFIVDTATEAEKILRAARGAEKALISDVFVFDVFTGASLGEGNKSVAIEVTIQPRDKTLTDEEIDAISAKVVEAVEKATGGSLRG
ncbi:MAG: phenylalanine--tRNA ligase subunit beta [Rhodobiaceae bacterium]|nr:phenylalanine--tRNA ligase subunit beta [Rhodobiaceae bacterium]